MNNKTIVILFVAITAVLVFTGCTGEKISQVAQDNTTEVSTSNDKNVENATNVSTSNDKSGETRIVTDSAGRQVAVPIKVERVADTWMGHNEVLAMLGADDRLVATMFSSKKKTMGV